MAEASPSAISRRLAFLIRDPDGELRRQTERVILEPDHAEIGAAVAIVPELTTVASGRVESCHQHSEACLSLLSCGSSAMLRDVLEIANGNVDGCDEIELDSFVFRRELNHIAHALLPRTQPRITKRNILRAKS